MHAIHDTLFQQPQSHEVVHRALMLDQGTRQMRVELLGRYDRHPWHCILPQSLQFIDVFGNIRKELPFFRMWLFIESIALPARPGFLAPTIL